jgi:purine-binding chemotaxis protein CheW
MSRALTESGHGSRAVTTAGDGVRDYVTFTIANQLFGIPVLQVQDVLAGGDITPIPLAPPEIAGALNLRGRIVTAVDVRLRLGLREREDGKSKYHEMSIVVDHNGELYSLMVDEVGEVLSLDPNDFGRNPPTLDPKIREFSNGIYRLKQQLLVVLDVEGLLDYDGVQAA